MESSTNPDVKEFISRDELIKNVLSQYNIDIYEIENIKFKDTDKQRAVYKISTDKGYKCLKKVYYNKPCLFFIYSIIEWLNSKKINCPRLISTKKGLKYVEYNKNLFILMDWIDGRKCDYNTMEDIISSAENLAKIHESSKYFIPIEGSDIKRARADYYNSFNKRFFQLLEMSNKAFRIKDKFSKLYLEHFDYNIEKAKKSVYILSLIDFSKPIGDEVSGNAICHLDYVNKNIIFTPENILYVIDFDKSSLDYPVHDISSFLKRILKRKDTSWDFEVFKSSIESYETIRALSYNEHLVILAFLMFPQKYWKTSRDYYKNRYQCDKEAFITILKKICVQEAFHDEFCKKVEEYIEEKFKEQH